MENIEIAKTAETVFNQTFPDVNYNYLKEHLNQYRDGYVRYINIDSKINDNNIYGYNWMTNTWGLMIEFPN